MFGRLQKGWPVELNIRQAKAPASSWALKNVGSRRPSDRHSHQQIVKPDQIEHPPEIVGERRQAELAAHGL